MKQCSKCANIKSIKEFYKDNSRKNRRRSSCVVCDRSREDTERLAKWRCDNREKLRLAAAERYRTKKTEIIAQIARHHTTARGRAVRLVVSARGRAKKYGYDFDLNNDAIERVLLEGRCEKSGIILDLNPRSDVMRNPLAPSIDRIDNSGGYTISNSQVVCNMFNCGKGEATEIDFIAMCVAVAERHADNPEVIQRLKELRNAEF